MSNIYNIQQNLLAIFDEIEENEGELTPEIEEQLSIKQEEFRDKIKSYTDVIKYLNLDITSIDEERERLYNLKKSKEKTIDRLKKVIIDAIDKFGDTNKSGNKYIDYGTGKISVRNTEAIEVEEDSIDRFVNRFITCLKWYSDNNQLSANIIKPEDILDWVNDISPSEEAEGIIVDKYTIKDINNLNASIDLDINISDIISTDKGIELLRSLLKYNVFKIKAKADKRGIKENAKNNNHFMPVYAKLVNNKAITIK